jgi:hypothetical protein
MLQSLASAQLLQLNGGHASKRFYFPLARPATFRRASGIDHLPLPATGTRSRVVFVLGIVVPGAYASAWG